MCEQKRKVSKNMDILYLDCFSGISGDMFIGAMIDLGVDEEYLRGEISKLNLNEFSIEIKRGKRCGISGIKFDVISKDVEHTGHIHGDKSHGRNISDINKILDESGLSGEVTETAKKIFLIIGEAEARVHGVSLEKIHFHEVGAVDSIVDTVAASVCYHYLKPDRVLCGAVSLGSGFVKCDHGTMPVPAPATAEILKGIPVKSGAAYGELTTPTGAAIIKALVDKTSKLEDVIINKTGYGLGSMEYEVPNVLRVFECKAVDDIKK